MSRVGRKPILVPEGVKVEINRNKVLIKGPRGDLELEVPSLCEVVLRESQILVKRGGDDRQARSTHGTVRSLIFNMVKGVSEGFEKYLEIVGMGYRASLEDSTLVLSLGYSHLVRYTPPKDVEVEVTNANAIRVYGCDKQKVGEVTAQIRAFKKPEPYKGKGIRYRGEVIRRKVGKAALGTKE
ncbi:50S ribosomal protein L6 [Candidatus Aerophobetes bacterium]|uniref:Large ribosomal subunit protein uL6 n=1 Tax=Aerophobetes bacterium TaxID=2030807 RepID=A0A523TBR4_UNCAE|nr:MAG: 50S ribosomal protein L6 [Candidatus Aerophobetes bacterium]